MPVSNCFGQYYSCYRSFEESTKSFSFQMGARVGLRDFLLHDYTTRNFSFDQMSRVSTWNDGVANHPNKKADLNETQRSITKKKN